MLLTLKKKIIGIAVIAALLPAITILILLFIQKTSLTQNIVNEVDMLARSNLKGNAESVMHQCEIANEMINTELKQSLFLAKDLNKALGSFAFGAETINWEVINQETKMKTQLNLPKMTIGGAVVGSN